MDSNESLNIQIQNKLIEELTQSNSELKLINSFAKDIQECKTTNDILITILKKFEINNSYKHCSIYLLDNSERNLILENTSGFIDQKNLKKSINIAQQNDILTHVANTGEYEIIEDLALNMRFQNHVTNYNSQIVIPMLNKVNKVVGVFDFKHPVKNYFKKNHLETLNTIASLIATKIIQTKDFEKITKYQNQLEEYVHVVSHDLKSPLRSINALFSWIKEDNQDNLNESTLSNINLIDDILLQMENLIASILNYTKIDYVRSKKNDVDLNLLLIDIKKVVFIPENMTLKTPRKLPTLHCEKTKIFQIFQNLIGNAVKYNDKEKGEIVINFSETISQYQFSVKDNGIGINEKYHDKIFEIFQSLEITKDSSGIGLSIVKKLVNYFHGEIWIESKENIGSTFYFTIKKES